MPFRLPLLSFLLLLTVAGPAHAGWFPAEPIDGPSGDIVAFGDVDLARDGTGGAVYVKREGGVAHVFLARHTDGVWQAPERVDVGVEAAASQPVIAAADGNRLAIVWVGDGRLYGAFFPGGPPGPLSAPQVLHDPGAGETIGPPHVDMGITGTAYAVFRAPGGGGADVRAVRLFETAWEPIASPVDIDPSQPAGDGAGRPRVAVSAEGYAVAVWGEGHADGRRRVFGRRLTGLALSAVPQEVSLTELAGAPGGDADSPDLDIEDDGSYAWAVVRQDIGGTSRAYTRRLVGSLWEAAVPIDGGGPAGPPRVSLSGRGEGSATVANSASNAVQASLNELDLWGESYRVDATGSSAAPDPVTATGERRDSVVVWRTTDPAGAISVVGRHRPGGEAFAAPAVLSQPAFGPLAGPLEVGEDRMGDFAAGFLQGEGEGARVVISMFDRAPGRPQGLTTTGYQRFNPPRLRWKPGTELLGTQTFRILLDGEQVMETTAAEARLPARVRDGRHTWQVIAVDRRGQEAVGRTRPFFVDSRKPKLRVRVSRSGRLVRVVASARDERSGVRYIVTHFGDRTPRTLAHSSLHRYARPGRYELRVRAVDRARNATTRVVRVRIR